ncbi:MAG: hypothetical protein KGL58_01120, partial [Pseudomonadota bacterium]|nr:hypothetical protein [Pseudomonadota bacterium]
EDSFPGPAAAFAGSGREDPGILVTGQIRSNAMMQAVLYDVNARGLVLAGLHAAGSRQALDQVVGFYAQQDQDEARHLLVLSLTAILSQWLIRPQEGQIMQHWILRQPVGQGRLSAEAAEGLAHDREQLKQALLQTGER